MARGRRPQGDNALTGAERQARYRTRQQAQQAMPAIRYRRPTDRRTRPQRWHDAVAELIALQAEYAAWADAMPGAMSRKAMSAWFVFTALLLACRQRRCSSNRPAARASGRRQQQGHCSVPTTSPLPTSTNTSVSFPLEVMTSTV